MSREIVRVLTGGTLISGTGQRPMENAVVVTKGPSIMEVGKEGSVDIPRGSEVINTSGRIIMPGMVDAHLHLWGSAYADLLMASMESPVLQGIRAYTQAKRVLEAGFTAIRDAGSRNAISVCRAIEEGTVIGPRTVPVGFGITQTAGHGDTHDLDLAIFREREIFGTLADGVDECRKVTRQQIREGARAIKTFVTGGLLSQKDRPDVPQYTIEELKAIVFEAHRMHMKVMAHSEGVEGAMNAIEAGIDTIEHGFGLDDEACRLMVKKNMILVPTLRVIHGIATSPATPEYAREKARALEGTHLESFRRAFKLGVKIALGTDTFADQVSPFGNNAYEMQLMVEAGLPPMDTIVAATKNGAGALGLGNQIGTVEKGKFADILVVKGNPLEDIKILQNQDNLQLIMKNGDVIKRLNL